MSEFPDLKQVVLGPVGHRRQSDGPTDKGDVLPSTRQRGISPVEHMNRLIGWFVVNMVFFQAYCVICPEQVAQVKQIEEQWGFQPPPRSQRNAGYAGGPDHPDNFRLP